MMALTVRQPWAWAIVHADKTVENRSWATTYRGPLAIHAGANRSRIFREQASYWMDKIGVMVPARDDLLYGCVIGTVDLVDCVRESGDRWGMQQHWHWVLRNAQSCSPRFVRGRLGLWTCDV
jgi:hypothetical protein